MCINVTVNLPNVESFLLLYSLKCGCVVILAWTCIRTFLCFFFFFVSILEVFSTYVMPVGSLLMPKDVLIAEDIAFTVYMAYIAMLVAQAFLFVHTYYLALGLYYESSRILTPFLACRFITWIIEIIALFVLCMSHKIFIGWYLGMLMFVVLESYCFIVVYSFYVNLVDYERDEDEKNFSPSESYA